LAKVLSEPALITKSSDGVKKYFLTVVNNLPVLVFSITNVSEDIRQEAEVAEACVFPLKY
jgi:hypothetical protein